MGSVSGPAELRTNGVNADPEHTASAIRERRWPAPLLAPQLAKGILITVLLSFFLIAFLKIRFVTQGFTPLALCASYMIIMLGLQLFYFSRPTNMSRSPIAYLALLVQAALVYLPFLQFHQAWIGMPGFLAGSVLLVLPPRLAWPTFTLVIGSVAVAQAMLTGVLNDVAYATVSPIITGLVVYGMTRLANLVTELHAAQTELAKLAVAQERLRFARDLHDLLGYSLSAITLKSELTHRLMSKDQARAQEELSEVLDISRQALSDVRSVASGYRELSLDDEAEAARSVLLAAEVDVRMDLGYGELPTRVRTVLATVLREGITNVLRHSKAERCDITVRQAGNQVWIDIINDGVSQAATQRTPRGGSGIANLSARVAALDGTLSAGLDPDGRFRLHATAPVSRTRTRWTAEPELG
jgi:two-component system sensor histidine kinase DesK